MLIYRMVYGSMPNVYITLPIAGDTQYARWRWTRDAAGQVVICRMVDEWLF